MKSYTDLEQSKKLAEILPLESADMWWLYITAQGKHIAMMHEEPDPHYLARMEGYGIKNAAIPCWSLAALLAVIKPINENTYTIRGTLDGGATISFDEITNVMYQEEEIIDAVFEMVVWLKEKDKI